MRKNFFPPEVIVTDTAEGAQYAVTHTSDQYRLIYHADTLFEAGALQRALERVRGVEVWRRP